MVLRKREKQHEPGNAGPCCFFLVLEWNTPGSFRLERGDRRRRLVGFQSGGAGILLMAFKGPGGLVSHGHADAHGKPSPILSYPVQPCPWFRCRVNRMDSGGSAWNEAVGGLQEKGRVLPSKYRSLVQDWLREPISALIT